MTPHFLLIHGAWHGAWCWDALRVHLAAAGCRSVAPDLPIEDPAAGLGDYRDAAVAALDRLPLDGGGELVVVGHSLGGLVAPLVAAVRPTGCLLLLDALVPEPHESVRAVTRRTPEVYSPGWRERAAAQIRHPDGSTSWPVDAAIDTFYPDCTPEEGLAAARRLRRQCWAVFDESSPLASWPTSRSAWIVSADDRVINPEQQRTAAAAHAAPVVELPGGHVPMLSRPATLAGVLVSLAGARSTGRRRTLKR